jgi:hypothetical protein
VPTADDQRVEARPLGWPAHGLGHW